MKRRSVFAIVVLCVFMAAVAASAAITVYITDTGAKYHTAGCRYLNKSKIPITLERAKA